MSDTLQCYIKCFRRFHFHTTINIIVAISAVVWVSALIRKSKLILLNANNLVSRVRSRCLAACEAAGEYCFIAIRMYDCSERGNKLSGILGEKIWKQFPQRPKKHYV